MVEPVDDSHLESPSGIGTDIGQAESLHLFDLYFSRIIGLLSVADPGNYRRENNA